MLITNGKGSRFLRDLLSRYGLDLGNFFQSQWMTNLEILIIGIVVFPIACVKNLHGLRHTNVIGVLGITLVILVIIIIFIIFNDLFFIFLSLLSFKLHHL